MFRQALVVAVAVIVLLLIAWYSMISNPPYSLSGFSIESINVSSANSTVIEGHVYVASTALQQEQGFQMQKSFGNCNGAGLCVGMLFVFKVQQTTCFWMHNTPIPLQQDWISANGTVTYIYQGQPYNNSVRCANATYVLETYPNASIVVGDKLFVRTQ